MKIIVLYLLIFGIHQCFGEWMDQCRGDVLNANSGAKIAQSLGIAPRESKDVWQKCAVCINKVGKQRCSAPTIAVTSTCLCQVNNTQTCQCKHSLSAIGIIVMAILPPLLLFFGLGLSIYLCCRKSSSPTQPAGFYQTSIVDARTVGLSPAVNYTVPHQRKTPRVVQQPMRSMPQNMPKPPAQSTLTRTPHYVSRANQQRFQ